MPRRPAGVKDFFAEFFRGPHLAWGDIPARVRAGGIELPGPELGGLVTSPPCRPALSPDRPAADRCSPTDPAVPPRGRRPAWLRRAPTRGTRSVPWDGLGGSALVGPAGAFRGEIPGFGPDPPEIRSPGPPRRADLPPVRPVDPLAFPRPPAVVKGGVGAKRNARMCRASGRGCYPRGSSLSSVSQDILAGYAEGSFDRGHVSIAKLISWMV